MKPRRAARGFVPNGTAALLGEAVEILIIFPFDSAMCTGSN